MDLQEQLIRDEGVKLFVYDDANDNPVVPGYTLVGHPTIGIGRALDTRGITMAEALYLNNDDIQAVQNGLLDSLPWLANLDVVRFAALENMAFNLGVNGLLGFTETLAAIKQGNYELAAEDMLQSEWAQQVGDRANRLAQQIKTGVWQ